MKLNRMSGFSSRLLTATLALGLIVSLASAAEVVIANTSLGASQVDKSTLQNLFLGKISELSGTGITVATLKEGPVHEAFLAGYIGKNAQQFLAHWRKLVFSGQGTQPPAFTTEEDLVDFVAKTPGAIGYISDGTAHDGVKVLGVN